MMDMRTVQTIKYGLVSAVRTELNPDIFLELGKKYIAFDTETTGTKKMTISGMVD